MLSRLLARSLRRTAGGASAANTVAAARAAAAGAVRRSCVAVGAARVAAVRSIATAAALQQPASANPAAAAAAGASSSAATAAAAAGASSGACAYPGAPTAGFTNAMEFVASHRIIPSYRVTDEHGVPQVAGYKLPMDGAKLKQLYAQMIVLRTMDGIFYDAQRQGRISFFMESKGEEAIHFGSAAALDLNDVVFAQYREAGVLLHRGFTLDDFANQCFSNALDLGKGRQMPVHYGSRRLNVQTISSPLSTQIPQASGAAYALKLQKNNKNCVICYFGEGAASEGDFHAALNFAATLDCPVVFFCRNNGFAISTPTKEQYRGDGIVARGPGYGIHSIRVDGNDLLAVYEVTRAARKMAVEQNKPVLIEAMTYRGGHHSTSDDSSRYRSADEIVMWTDGPANPLTRTRLLLEANGLWDAAQEDAHRKQAKRDVFDALKKAEAAKKPAASQLFTDVYDVEPQHIRRQRLALEAHLQTHGSDYQLDAFEPEATYTNPSPKP